MILIRFPNSDAERRALGYLPGRFAFRTWDNGDMLVPEAALAALAMQGISFTVHGPARYKHNVPTFRNPVAPAV